jgi:hypothetical protein
VDHVLVLLSLSQCTVCSAKRGVTNDGTIVHCETREEREREEEEGTIVHCEGKIETEPKTRIGEPEKRGNGEEGYRL